MTRLKYARVMREWSLDRLGKESGLSGSDISKMERGRLEPYPSQLERLARALRVPAETLLGEVSADEVLEISRA